MRRVLLDVDRERSAAAKAQCRFPFNLSLSIFQLAQLTLSMCHQAAAGLADVTPARHRLLPPPGSEDPGRSCLVEQVVG